MQMYLVVVEMFWAVYFLYSNTFSKDPEESKLNRRADTRKWKRSNGWVIEATEDTEEDERIEEDDTQSHEDLLSAKQSNLLSQAESRLEWLYELLDWAQDAIWALRQEAKDDLSKVGSINPKTLTLGEKAKGIVSWMQEEIKKWEDIMSSSLQIFEEATDTRPLNDAGYNTIHTGGMLALANRIITYILDCTDVGKLFTVGKKADAYRNKRMITYSDWLRIKMLVNGQLLRSSNSVNLRAKATVFYLKFKVMYEQKQTQMVEQAKSKVIVDREPIYVELSDLNGKSYSLNIEDALDKYRYAKSLADKNGVDCRTMQDMLEEEETPVHFVKSVYTDCIDILNACGGIKAQAARKMGLSIYKFNQLLAGAIKTSQFLSK